MTNIIKIGTSEYTLHKDTDTNCGDGACAFANDCDNQCTNHGVSQSFFKKVEESKSVNEYYPNANPHMDMIIAWAKDSTLKVEWSENGEKWYPCGTPLWQPDVKFRFAPKSKTFFLKVASVDDELVVHHTGEKHADIKIVMVDSKIVNVEQM
jgi:hypothetical protein